jgi:hypothetical protein
MQGFYNQWFSPEEEAGTRAGYWLEFCPHGVRPQDGYRTRRLGRPRLFMLDAADGVSTLFAIGAGATGEYFFDVSQTWLTGLQSRTSSFSMEGPTSKPSQRIRSRHNPSTFASIR